MKKNREDAPAGTKSQEAESPSRSEMKAAKAAEKTRRIEEMKAAKAASAEAKRSDTEAKKAAKAAEKTRRIEEMKAAKAAKKDAKRNVAQDGGVKPAAANDSTQPSDKTSKRSERAAKKAAKVAAKARRIEEMQAAKATKKAAKAASAEAKRSDTEAKKAAKAAAKAASKSPEKTPRNKTAKVARPEKDPLRPRFAVAPGSVRVFTVLAVLSAVLSAVWAAVAALAANTQITISVIEDVPQAWMLGSAIAAAVAALLWVFAAVKVSTGFRSGLIVGWLSVILSLVTVVAPFALILGLTLQSRDSRDWAI